MFVLQKDLFEYIIEVDFKFHIMYFLFGVWHSCLIFFFVSVRAPNEIQGNNPYKVYSLHEKSNTKFFVSS